MKHHARSLTRWTSLLLVSFASCRDSPPPPPIDLGSDLGADASSTSAPAPKDAPRSPDAAAPPAVAPDARVQSVDGALATDGREAAGDARDAGASASPPDPSGLLALDAGPSSPDARPRPSMGVDLSSRLVGFWRFSEGMGASTVESSTGGRAGVLESGPAWTKDLPPGLKYPNTSALSFDGVDDVVTIADPTPAVTGDYTISVWIRPTSARAVSVLARTSPLGPLSRWGEQIRITAEGKFEHHNWQVRNVTGTTTVAEGVWYHVAVTSTAGGLMRLYVNGVEEGTPVAPPPLEECDRIVIGSRTGNGMGFFRGTVDELAVYGRGLTAAQVRALAAGDQPGT